jgi:type IV pilus secretin PilQ/predicted competence protein
MRTTWRPWGFAALLLASLILTCSALNAAPEAAVRVNAVIKDGVVRLEARANAPFEYTTYRPTDKLFVVDLTGVSAADPGGSRVLESDLVSSYRLLQFHAGQKPVVRLEILLREPVQPRIERQNPQELMLIVARSNGATPAAHNASSVTAKAAPVALTVHHSAASLAIEGIQLRQSGTQTEVHVAANGHLEYRELRLSQPERLVLDFTGARLEASHQPVAGGVGPVRGVRAAQFTPEVARVVIDLEKPTPYQIHAEGNQLTVAFASGDVPAAEHKPASRPAVPKSAIRPETEHRASAQVPSPSKSDPLQESNAAVSLPASLTQSNAGLASPAPVKLEPATAKSEPAAAEKPEKPAGNPASSVTANPNGNAGTSQPAVVSKQPANSAAATAEKYSGEPVSVNLKDVDLKDFFRLIHEISGLNVVVDPTVKGTLTIVLDEVPWDQALDIVLKNNDLDKQVDGNVLRIATKATLKKEAEQSRDLAKAQAEAIDLVTTTRTLSYAKASALTPTLQKFLSARGQVLADDRSNTLIIRDVPDTIPVVDNLLRQLDRRPQQVEIEARVVAASRSFARDIGTQLAFATSAVNGKNIFGGATGVGTSPIVRTSPPLPIPPLVTGTPSGGSGSLPLSTNLGAQAPTSGFSYAFSSPNFALDLIITAAESKGVGKLLSEPKILTQNNKKGVVKQGTKIPIQTVVNNTVSVQFIDAVLKLEVTPQITADGSILMDVVVENTQIDPAIERVNGIPALDTQGAESAIIVNDGGTMVMGGIIISSQRTDIQQVPLIGSIPLLGNLFKRTKVETSSQELLFFLTPRILPG